MGEQDDEREDTPEEEKLWLMQRYVIRKRKYGNEVAQRLLAYDAIFTKHFADHYVGLLNM